MADKKKEKDVVARIVAEMSRPKLPPRRPPRRTGNLNQDIYDGVQRIESKHDAWIAAEAQRDSYIQTLQECYLADKRFLKGIIILLAILLLLFAGITGVEKLLPFL